MRLSSKASLLTLVAVCSHFVAAASDLGRRWEALRVNCSSSVPSGIADLSLHEATALFDELTLDRRSRSRWLQDIGEWHLYHQVDLGQAQEFLEASAALGNAAAQFLTGALSNQETEATGTSLLYYRFASQGGSMAATMALGYRHLHGYDVAPRSCEAALRQYKVVADDVMRHNHALPNPTLPIQVFSMPAPVRLSDDQTKLPPADRDEVQSVEYLRRRAMHSSNTELLVRTASLVLFTDLYRSGDSLDTLSAKREATALLKRAAELGSGAAKALLGHVLAYGLTGERADVQEAIQLYEDALNSTARESSSFLGRSEAANGLGLIYLNGLGGYSVNVERAMSLFRLSAREGHADGVFNTAKIMGAVDPEKATQYLEVSADVGHVGAMFKLARVREKQRFRGLQDGSHSCEAIVKLYKQVAEHSEYGRELLSHAAQAVRDSQYKHALRLYLIAAEMGYEVAEHNAAWIMERYELSSLREAAIDTRYNRLVKRGIAQQSADARVRAGDMEFAMKNYRRAMVHYLKAADWDPIHPRAQYSIAYMLERGLGTISGDRELHRARWYYGQVQQNEPLMNYVMAPMKLKIEVEILLQDIAVAVDNACGFIVKAVYGQETTESSGVILVGVAKTKSADASSEPPSFVPVMAFNGVTSSVVVKADMKTAARSFIVKTWVWLETTSSNGSPQTLLDWSKYLRVDVVPHPDGSSWQLQVSSADESRSVLTLTKVVLKAQQWQQLTVIVDPLVNSVLLQVGGATDSGNVLLSPSIDTSMEISVGRLLRSQDERTGGFVGKLWGFRVEVSASPSIQGHEVTANANEAVIDLQFDVIARVDETIGREAENSRLVNGQQGDAGVEAHDIDLRMVLAPRSH